MDKSSNVNPFISSFFPIEIKGVEFLIELALDLGWSWHHQVDEIWKELDAELWQQTHNPWIVLRTVSKERLKKVLGEPSFAKKIEELVELNRVISKSNAWFQNTYKESPLNCVAYFSMEFMITEALPIYSGGLGNVAGDQLKSASDLGVPIVGIGLLYQQGYFRQIIDKEGAQQALYPYNDPGQLPITPLRKTNGEWLRLEVLLPGGSLWIRTWQVQIGRVKLFLLDSNDAANIPYHRGITSELYGGGTELRLKQEIILGIGGWRLLEALNIHPKVCHLNEGHAGFAVLERTKSFMNITGQPFDIALAVTRAGNLFTTHTAVSAGFDQFDPSLIQQYLGHYAQNDLQISFKQLLKLGRLNPNDDSESFNMAYLAIRGSGFVNGVSCLHQKVSQQIFNPLFPRWSKKDVPIGYVTNGVHMPSWDSVYADALWTEVCGKDRWLKETEPLTNSFQKAEIEQIWLMRKQNREDLIRYARKKLTLQLSGSGATVDELKQVKHLFDSNTLTIGFSRRFATYKRPNLLLSDPERLIAILTNAKYPVQLILAGKAHPADKPGQALIQQWTQFIKRAEVKQRVIFLSDYDMQMSENLIQGVDVWINTPKRPWEACGTSGMKCLVNGGLNLSELDGWWVEAYNPQLGWAIGDGEEHGDNPDFDRKDAESLYNILENQVIPEFYERNSEGIPVAWVNRIKESMSRLTPHFSANRAVREYTETYYIPAAKNFDARTKDNAKLGEEIVNWNQNLHDNWSFLRFSNFKWIVEDQEYIFEVQVYTNGLPPDTIQVQLYAEGEGNEESFKQEMVQVRALSGESNTYIYRLNVPLNRPAEDYTPRIVPYFNSIRVPLENNLIAWQR